MSENLVEIAYRTLKEKIIECAYPPGSLLSAKRIAAELSMSRTPIQGAVIMLEHDGYVTSVEKRGVIVKELSLRDFCEISEVIYCAMVYAMENTADVSQAIDLARFDELLLACARAKEAGAYVAYSRHTVALFELIAATTNNNALLTFFRELLNKYLRYCCFWALTEPNKSSYARLDLLSHLGEALHRGDRAGAVAIQRQFMLKNRETLNALRMRPPH